MTTKSSSRFAAWQDANQLQREAIIDEYLGFLAKTRVKVRHPTALADLVAKHISQVQGKPCNKSTLLRNIRYKAKLLSYQAKRLAAGTNALNSRTVTDPADKVLVTSAQLESGNLRRELDRLKIYVTSLEEQIDLLPSQGRQSSNSANIMGSATQLSDYEFRFIRTCQALRLLLSHLSVIVHLDPGSQCILDTSKRRNNVIVDKNLAGSFFDWLAAQEGSVR